MSVNETDQTRIHDDAPSLASDFASALLSRLETAQREGRVPHVALTGGGIAEAIHQELGRRAVDASVDWERVVFWWGDERFVAPDSEDRNALAARRDFLSPVGVPEAHVHEVPSTTTADHAEAAAAQYAAELEEHWTEFEVLVLGLGPDGHIASLFPTRDELEITDELTSAVHDSPKPPPDRVTLTYPALRRSRAVWFVVSGAEKAPAVAAARSEGPLGECPARGVRGTAETVWWLDQASASSL